ncbi:(Na+)-NQR maturation NqrM, partial [Motilimonas sp. 1_MG-2023]
MTYFLATFVVFVLVIASMSVGYIFQKKAVSGSCGGLGSIGIDKECD